MEITYSYIFGNHDARQFTIALDRETLRFLQQAQSSDLPWTRLGTHKCSVCTLHEDTHIFCPVALNLARIVEVFKDYFSYESVKVTVTTRERVSWKTTSLQEGLSSLLGLIMVTSGCPVMEHLKPMARFHLPFSTLEETIYRIVSMYLMAQYFRNTDGKQADWELQNLKKIYEDISQVNRDFAQRLLEAAKKDANVNALINLDCLATMIPMTIKNALRELRGYFSAYLE